MHHKFMVDAISTAEHGQRSDDHSDESNDDQGMLDDHSDESNDDQGMLSDTGKKNHLYSVFIHYMLMLMQILPYQTFI